MTTSFHVLSNSSFTVFLAFNTNNLCSLDSVINFLLNVFMTYFAKVLVCSLFNDAFSVSQTI
jgi:hypothetical protein